MLTPEKVRDVSPDVVAEVAELSGLDDDALWQVAHSTISPECQEQLQDFKIQQEHRLTPDKAAQLDTIRREIGQWILLKAQAYVLLKERGYHVPQP